MEPGRSVKAREGLRSEVQEDEGTVGAAILQPGTKAHFPVLHNLICRNKFLRNLPLLQCDS